MTIYNFAKLSLNEKANLLENKAVYLDNFVDGDNLVNTYFFEGFFAESILDLKTGKIIEIIPYQYGYRMDKRKVDNYLKHAC
ncbi:MAG: hypothetical protein H0W73_10605 [Bacteroidetes bacterium]|nr:hypothetical protein [Bacteroidota bacterium]